MHFATFLKTFFPFGKEKVETDIAPLLALSLIEFNHDCTMTTYTYYKYYVFHEK